MTPGPSDAALAQRIDRWLWHARFAKTRVAAQRLALSGHVRINREKIRAASRPVRVGDVITIALKRHDRVVRVKGIAERRAGPADAALLFDDRTVASATPAPVTCESTPALLGNEMTGSASDAAIRALKGQRKADTPGAKSRFRSSP